MIINAASQPPNVAPLRMRGKADDLPRAPSFHRQHPRVDLGVEVSMASEHTFHTGIAENISEGGFFVKTHIPPPIGEMVHIMIALGSSRQRVTLSLTAQVQWVRVPSGEGLPPGCGLKFLSVSDEALTEIRSFIARRLAVEPDR